MRIIKLTLIVCLTLGITSAFNAQNKKTLSVETAVMQQYDELYPESISQLQWMGDTDYYTYVKDDELIKGNATRKEKVILTLKTLNDKGGFELKRFPRIVWDSNTKFRFKNGSAYFTYDIKSKKGNQILKFGNDADSRDYHQKSNHLAYLVENNLFVQTGEQTIQVTDNEEGIVSGYGYARQEFGITKGTFWSEDGNQLAFYQKDERNVSSYPLVEYDSKPAHVREQKYPMAGMTSEIPSVGIYHLDIKTITFLDLENGKKDDSFYGTNLAWGPEGKFVYLAIINRDQNHMWLKKYDVNTGAEVATLFEETNEKYVEPERPMIFVPNHQDEFLWFSERDGFDNLYLYNTKGKILGKTKLKFPITSFIGFDKSGKTAFVQGTSLVFNESHGFAINLDDMSVKKITKESGTHYVSPSPSGSFFIDNWTNVDVPRNIDLMLTNGKKAKNMLTAPDPMENYQWAKPELFTMNSFDGTELYCRMIKPSNFDPNKKYPVLVYTYNGPHVQLVKNRWLGGAALWMYSLAEEGYIVFTVDGRGSGNRGRDFEQATFRRLGYVETKDQEFCTNWLKAQDFTDEDRFAIHGWSFGGFMTNNLMLRTPGLFKVGVAGGPVIDWSLYEVMYTERYMDTPETNPEGYEKTTMTNYVTDLKGKLLEIHGAVDDVVVPQHSMKMLKASVDNGIQIDFFTYPGHPHNVRGKDRVHLMTKVLNYIKDGLE